MQIRDLKSSDLNFVSFTPGTSFDLRSEPGHAARSASLLYWLLQDGVGPAGRGAPNASSQGR